LDGLIDSVTRAAEGRIPSAEKVSLPARDYRAWSFKSSQMSQSSSIEWTNSTWNPVTGCAKVSAGCKHCYAARFAERFRGVPGHPYENGFDLQLRSERIDWPLKWVEPRRIFVNSMSDLYHPGVDLNYILRVFGTMWRASWHVFQILTKRAERLGDLARFLPWPSNVWQGVSVERRDLLWRVEQLRKVPSVVRFLSLEPLLGPLDDLDLCGIDWVIVGGESGPHARPIEGSWVCSIRDLCLRAGVPFFFKQWGGVRKHLSGRTLEGRTWDEFPRDDQIKANVLERRTLPPPHPESTGVSAFPEWLGGLPSRSLA
jgi:protein gp37